jgi:hypothetical protein
MDCWSEYDNERTKLSSIFIIEGLKLTSCYESENNNLILPEISRMDGNQPLSVCFYSKVALESSLSCRAQRSLSNGI